MTTKDLVLKEIEAVPDDRMDDLYAVVKQFTQGNGEPDAAVAAKDGRTLMAKLREIKINAPRDFSENFDQYASGEKSIDENLP